MCMVDEFDYFSSKWIKNEITLQKNYKNGTSFKFKKFPDQCYAVSHAGLTLWFQSYSSRVDVYEFLIRDKPVPTWKDFVEFLKEC
jgi:hypothetical protein